MPSLPTQIARSAIVTACIAASSAPAAFAQSDTATGTGSFLVVHGIPGRDVGPTLDPLLPVDVLVNGSICLIQGLSYEQIAGPFTVPAATYDVKISLASTTAPCSNSPVITASVPVAVGSFASVVAALSPSGAPTAYAFADDLSAITSKLDARVIAAHAADAPAVDVRLRSPNGDLFKASDLSPGKEASATVPGNRNYAITVVPAGANKPVAATVDVLIPYQGVALAFAVGSFSTNSVVVLTKVIPSVF